jgi:hypothetical protein
MGTYKITCIGTQAAPTPPIHKRGHIIRVGTTDDAGNYRVLTVSEVYGLMKSGNKFFTTNPDGTHPADVEPDHCGSHNVDTLRSKKDATTENNLDSLPNC